MRFSVQLNKAINETREQLLDRQRAAVIQLFSLVVIKTPVDKGGARSNWFCELGAANNGAVGRAPETSGNAALDDIRVTVSQMPLAGQAILFNNLPYIERLEDGYSQQAPAGMVKTSIAEWRRIVREV